MCSWQQEMKLVRLKQWERKSFLLLKFLLTPSQILLRLATSHSSPAPAATLSFSTTTESRIYSTLRAEEISRRHIWGANLHGPALIQIQKLIFSLWLSNC